MDFLQRLRTTTRSAHNQIERNSLFTKIITKDITLSEYSELLQILYQFIKPREIYISNKYEYLISGREKIPLLKADLYELGHINLHKQNKVNQEIYSEADALGYLYVVEGSTLGGQVLTQYLKSNEKLSKNIPVHYFYSYGDETKNKWNEFLNTLNKNLTLSEQDTVIKHALKTFEALFDLVKN